MLHILVKCYSDLSSLSKLSWYQASKCKHLQARSQTFLTGVRVPLPFPLLPPSLFPRITARGSGERYSSCSGSGPSPAAKRILVQFKAQNLLISFSLTNCKRRKCNIMKLFSLNKWWTVASTVARVSHWGIQGRTVAFELRKRFLLIYRHIQTFEQC